MGALSITQANVLRSTSGTVFTGKAGEALTQGLPVYYDSTNSVYKKANAIGASPINVVAGICMTQVGAANQDIVVCSRDPNFQPGYTIAAGNVAIVGNVAGQVNNFEDRISGWYVTSLGIGIGNNRVNFVLQGSNSAFA